MLSIYTVEQSAFTVAATRSSLVRDALRPIERRVEGNNKRGGTARKGSYFLFLNLESRIVPDISIRDITIEPTKVYQIRE